MLSKTNIRASSKSACITQTIYQQSTTDNNPYHLFECDTQQEDVYFQRLPANAAILTDDDGSGGSRNTIPAPSPTPGVSVSTDEFLSTILSPTTNASPGALPLSTLNQSPIVASSSGISSQRPLDSSTSTAPTPLTPSPRTVTVYPTPQSTTYFATPTPTPPSQAANTSLSPLSRIGIAIGAAVFVVILLLVLFLVLWKRRATRIPRPLPRPPMQQVYDNRGELASTALVEAPFVIAEMSATNNDDGLVELPVD